MFLHEDRHSGDLIVKMLELVTTKAACTADVRSPKTRRAWRSRWGGSRTGLPTPTSTRSWNEYGGVYSTEAGQRRHVQLELVESKHIAATHGFPTAVAKADRRAFMFLARSLGAVYPQTDAFQTRWTSRVDETRLGHYEIVQDSEPGPFVDMLEYGAAIMTDANDCLRHSVAPSLTNAPVCISEFGWWLKDSRPVTEAAYRRVMTPIAIDVAPNPAERKVSFTATISDYGLYGKFCKDWDRVIAQAVGRHGQVFAAIDAAFDFPVPDPAKSLGPAPRLPASLVALFPNLDILSPETPTFTPLPDAEAPPVAVSGEAAVLPSPRVQAPAARAALPPDVGGYYDDTRRGNPYPLQTVYYEVTLGQRTVTGRAKLEPAKMEYAQGFGQDNIHHSLPDFIGPYKLDAPIPANLPMVAAPVTAPTGRVPRPGEATFELPLQPNDPPADQVLVKVSLTDATPFDHPMDGDVPRFKGVEFDEPAPCGWTLADEWTTSYASGVQATRDSPAVDYGRIAFGATSSSITSLSGATAHSWSAPPKCLAAGAALALNLKLNRTSGSFRTGLHVGLLRRVQLGGQGVADRRDDSAADGLGRQGGGSGRLVRGEAAGVLGEEARRDRRHRRTAVARWTQCGRDWRRRGRGVVLEGPRRCERQAVPADRVVGTREAPHGDRPQGRHRHDDWRGRRALLRIRLEAMRVARAGKAGRASFDAAASA